MKPEVFFEQGKRFFFEDREKTAGYVRENCREDLAHVLRVAGEVAENRFLFDLRWDMERTYEMVAFPGEIDWLHQPGDDAEWIYQFNRMRYWVCLGQAYAVTGDEKYAQAFARQLCHWVKTVKREDPRCVKAWRTIEAGIRMENWLKAMCYFAGSPAITGEVMDTFVASVTEHAEYIMGVWDTYNLMSNWGVLANHGLYLAGVMLPDTPRTRQYREEALRRLEKEMDIQVYPDGFHWEQSPMYHNEVLRCYLDVVLLSRRNRLPLPPAIERKVRAMLTADLFAGKPDGNELCMGDSDEIDQRDLLTLGACIFEDGALKAGAYPKLDFESVWELGAGCAARYEALQAAPPASPSRAFLDSGNFYLRSGWGEDAAYLHFHCGTLGAGHGHADQLHLDLFCRGEDILVDAGRFTYVDKPERYEFKDSCAHNTTTVDGENFYVCKDSWECHQLCCAVNTRFADEGRYGFVQGGHLGYYQKGVFVNRRLIYIKPDILVVADEFYAAGPHTYRQHFHFGDAGALSGGEEGYCWQSGRNHAALCLLSALPLETQMGASRLSRHYNQAQPNTSLTVQAQGQGFASLFAVVSLDAADKALKLEAARVPVRSNFKGTVFEDPLIEALDIRKGQRRYTLVVAHQEYASPTDTFDAGGCTGFGGVVVFDRAAGETEIGTVLLH